MTIKLFVSDMDGTLLNSQHVIAPQTAEAVKRLQNSGIEFMIATGRDLKSAKPLLDMHDISCRLIAVNGAAIYDQDGQLLEVNPIDSTPAQKLLKHLEEAHCLTIMTTTTQTYASNQELYLARMQAYLTDMAEDGITDAQIFDHFNDIQPIEHYQWDAADEPILKFLVVSQEATVLANLYDELKTIEELDITSSSEENLEITATAAQKGLAIQQYLDHQNYHPSQVATIGDSFNDRSMLADYPNSYAMANAPESLQNLASYLAPSNDEFGVAAVIEDILRQQIDQ